jgi:hypothetical protein
MMCSSNIERDTIYLISSRQLKLLPRRNRRESLRVRFARCEDLAADRMVRTSRSLPVTALRARYEVLLPVSLE